MKIETMVATDIQELANRLFHVGLLDDNGTRAMIALPDFDHRVLMFRQHYGSETLHIRMGIEPMMQRKKRRLD